LPLQPIGGLFERLVLTRLKANRSGRCWLPSACRHYFGRMPGAGGEAIRFPVPSPQNLQSPDAGVLALYFPTLSAGAGGMRHSAAIALYFLLERTRLGAMIRAGVDDSQMARAVEFPSPFVTMCFAWAPHRRPAACWRTYLIGLSRLDADMLPLALIVVILGGDWQPAGLRLSAALSIGFIYPFGTALFRS